MKMIIDIPKVMYVNAKRDLLFGADILVKAIKNGTPLDDVKAEIDYERNLYLNLVGDSGYCNGLNKALKILDNIGKAESEVKTNEPTSET